MDQEKVYQLALFNTPLVGGFAFRQLIAHLGSARDVYAATKKDLIQIPGIGEKIASHLVSSFDLTKAESDLERAYKENVKVTFYTDPDYPKRLKQTNDAPAVLFIKGNCDLEQQRIISIVGTRKATTYGKQVVKELVEDLSDLNVIVVSGLAYGIDIETHKQCLQHSVPTIGVMATGINIYYPSRHSYTIEEMCKKGAVITEYGYDTKPEPAQFPARNRIIAGLSDATIVIEAAARGGALITAEFANSYDREVFAVPGLLTSKYSEGCNNLIKSHKAHLLSSSEDIVRVLSWDIQEEQQRRQNRAQSELNQEEQSIYSIFQGANPFLVDEVSALANMDPSKLSGILLALEFKGLIHSLPGKQYVRA